MGCSRILRCLPLLAVLLLGACAHTSQRYSSSAENVVSLQEIRKSSDRTIQLAPFTAAQPGLKEIMCRAAGPIQAPDQKAYEVFLRDAMMAELSLAGLVSEKSATVLDGYLEHIDFSSAIGAGTWTIRMRFTREGGIPFTVEHVHPFSTNFIADIACEQVAQALGPATQDFLKKVFAEPAFRELFGPRKP
jgi:hypothetical protein